MSLNLRTQSSDSNGNYYTNGIINSIQYIAYNFYIVYNKTGLKVIVQIINIIGTFSFFP